MASRARFGTGLLLRFLLLLAAGFALVGSFAHEDLGAVRLLAGLACIAAVAALWRYIQRTNRELARFIEAIRFGDFSQGFGGSYRDGGFGELGEALDSGMRRMRDERRRLTEGNRFYEAVLDDAPVALLIIDAEGRVELANKASRRLFAGQDGVRTEDFTDHGAAFVQILSSGSTNAPRLVPLMIDSVPQAAMVSCASVHRLGGVVRAVAVQPIQHELNAVELAAQSDLIRVLTHEIMNSMTPVTSLAQTAAQLIASADRRDDPAIADARLAVETLSRRADGVMNFIQSYRQISRRPQPRRRSFAAREWAEELAALFRASDAGQGVALSLSVEPRELMLDADPDLLSQVLINLLRNGAEAASTHSEAPAVSLSFAAARDGRTQILIEDNGPGIPDELAQEVFLPFFTTKASGTGVGLSLARQLVLAHGGSIAFEIRPAGGASFRILL